MPFKSLVLKNTMFLILFFFAEKKRIKKVLKSQCNISTFTGSEHTNCSQGTVHKSPNSIEGLKGQNTLTSQGTVHDNSIEGLKGNTCG